MISELLVQRLPSLAPLSRASSYLLYIPFVNPLVHRFHSKQTENSLSDGAASYYADAVLCISECSRRDKPWNVVAETIAD